MKNLNYFPFERNRYYYGKLLTEQDFTQEQRYLNDKRRMGNRFLHGTGVVAGLNVIAVDEKSISLETGLAIDFSGREIVVDKPEIRKLALIDGFETFSMENRKDYVYLCIEYDEKNTQPSFNAAAGGYDQDRKEEYDKTQESYHLYLTDREPEQILSPAESFYLRQEVLYQDADVRISEIFPRFVKSGEKFQVTVMVENLGQKDQMSVSLKQDLICASWEDRDYLELDYQNRMMEPREKAVKTFICHAKAVMQGEISLNLKADQCRINRGGRPLLMTADNGFRIPVSGKDFYDEAERVYFRNAMDRIMQNNYPQPIYLSRIDLVRTENTYLIDAVENIPFKQYIYNNEFLAGMIEMFRQEIDALKGASGATEVLKQTETKKGTETAGRKTASGVITLDLGLGGKKGQRYFSEEIYHGLGLGYVRVSLAVGDEERLLCGSGEVFEKMDPKAELAASVDLKKGSFIAGARLLEPSEKRSMKLYWTAELLEESEETKKEDPHIYIKPNLVQMKVREDCYLEAICENLSDTGVIWSVKTRDGGTVNDDGMYTAPNRAGVYEVSARSCQNPEIGASVFIIVKE